MSLDDYHVKSIKCDCLILFSILNHPFDHENQAVEKSTDILSPDQDLVEKRNIRTYIYVCVCVYKELT